MRRRARVDANHGEVVQALRRVGALVFDLSRVGAGCPDLLVCHRGRLYLLEVKDGTKAACDRRLTKDEAAFAALWPVTVVLGPDDALRTLGISFARSA